MPTDRQTEAFEVLRKNWQKLPDDSQEFALSLVTQFKTKAFLTPKQWEWVQKLADAIEALGVPDFTKQMKSQMFAAGLLP